MYTQVRVRAGKDGGKMTSTASTKCWAEKFHLAGPVELKEIPQDLITTGSKFP